MSNIQPPSAADPAVIINPPWPALNRVNAILNGRSRFHSAEDYCGTLSIKSVVAGDALYEADGCRFAVSATNYLILNDRQTYTLTIAGEAVAETFCIFFRPGFAAETLNGLITPADRLLDDPFGACSQPVQFFEKLYPHDQVVTPILRSLYFAVQGRNASSGWYEEQFHLLAERMLWMHRGLRSEIERLPAVRAATRVELYRRIYRARDFMDAALDEALTLDRIAEIAWLSPHHFLRLFKQVFAVTPHQYLTRKRIEKAQRLLLSTNKPITQVGLESGLESASSFSRLFRSQVGVSPEAFRRARGILPAK